MLLGTNNLTMKKKVGMELSEKLNTTQNIYHTFGTSNPEVMDNPSWLHLTKHPKLSSSELRTKSHLYHNDKGKYGSLWTFCRKGMNEIVTTSGTIFVGGVQDEPGSPDYQVYNDIILKSMKGGTAIYGYPEKVFPPSCYHTLVVIGNKLLIVGGNNGRDRLKIYQVNLNTFQIVKLCEHKKVHTILNSEVVTDGTTIVITGGIYLSGKNNKKRYTYNIEKDKWI
jgi:hypothetical protein